MDYDFVRVPLKDPEDPYSGVKPRTRFAVGQLVHIKTGTPTTVIAQLKDEDGELFEEEVYVPSSRNAFARIEKVYGNALKVRLIEKWREPVSKEALLNLEKCLSKGDNWGVNYIKVCYAFSDSPIKEVYTRAGSSIWVSKAQAEILNPDHPQLLTYLKRRANAGLRMKAQDSLDRRIRIWNRDRTNRMLERFSNGLEAHSRTRAGSYANRYKAAGKKVAEIIAWARKTGASIPEQEAKYEQAISNAGYSFVSDLIREHRKYVLQDGRLSRPITTHCGHTTVEEEVVDFHVNGEGATRTLCRDCAVRGVVNGYVVEVMLDDGTPGVTNTDYVNVYGWSDGTIRMRSEPPLIGSYHSSRTVHTQRFDNSKRPSVGFELEFAMHKSASRTDHSMALEMKKKASAAVEGRILPGVPYCTFERDASVWFEMVSGYGDVDVHRHAIQQVFSGDPFKGQLVSHDGGKCGFHVHIQKPDSLRHALKLTKFYNDQGNENLIRSLARRYGDDLQYCKALKNHAADVEAEAARKWKSQTERLPSGEMGSRRKDYLKQAITSINSDRYVMVNFQPANTVEIRVFRGSLVPQTLLACLEFAYLSYTFTRDTPADLLTTKQFLEYIGEPEQRAESRYLRSYLKAKDFDVWMPNPKPEVLPMRRAA